MFNFVIDCNDASLSEYLRLKPEDYVRTFTRGDLNWCLQTYLILAGRAKVPVRCSNRLLKNHINIIHSDQLLKVKGDAEYFIVCVRADYPRRRWAQYHLVQNGNQLSSHSTYIPHWVQPGLIPRNPNRKGVKRVAYAGAPVKSNFAGTEESWKRLFEPHEIEFVVLPSGRWHDFSQVDVLIGLRSFDKMPYPSKPPTKLFNAWHAHIPFIGGYDSAFGEVGCPGEDYLLAGTAAEVVAAVIRLREEPQLYQEIVQNGMRKTLLYNAQTIAESWEHTFQSDLMQRYEQWKKRPVYEKLRFQLLQDIGLLEHNARQQLKRILKAGPGSPFLRKAVP